MTTLIDQLYGSGKAAEIEMIHDKITALCTEVAAMKKGKTNARRAQFRCPLGTKLLNRLSSSSSLVAMRVLVGPHIARRLKQFTAR